MLEDDRIYPDVIVASGRDGAVCGAIFAELLGHKTLKVVDCHFNWIGKDRKTTIESSSVSKETVEKKNVLIVDWARQSGETYKLIQDELKSYNPAALHSYALFWKGDSNPPPEYFGFRHDTVPLPPWSRSPAF